MTLALVGPGRAGGSLAAAARRAGLDVRLADRATAPAACAGADALLLCVPDESIEQACEALSEVAPALVGHVSGATGLEALDAAATRGAATFSLHPLQTIPRDDTDLTGAPCAISAGSPRAMAFATALAGRLELEPFPLDDRNRALYHAAACVASNFLITLEESAADLLERAGVERGRELLAPLVLRSAANWAERGAGALTGPIARGDEATVAGHRAAISELAPDLADLYRVLAERTEALAAGTSS